MQETVGTTAQASDDHPPDLVQHHLVFFLQVRLGEKEALDSTLRFFEDRAERLEQLEFYQVRVSTCANPYFTSARLYEGVLNKKV